MEEELEESTRKAHEARQAAVDAEAARKAAEAALAVANERGAELRVELIEVRFLLSPSHPFSSLLIPSHPFSSFLIPSHPS